MLVATFTVASGAFKTALNYGNPNATVPEYYGAEVGLSDWEFGPSSDHPGVILHLFGDGSVHSFTASTATDTYTYLISRNGGEPFSIEQ